MSTGPSISSGPGPRARPGRPAAQALVQDLAPALALVPADLGPAPVPALGQALAGPDPAAPLAGGGPLRAPDPAAPSAADGPPQVPGRAVPSVEVGPPQAPGQAALSVEAGPLQAPGRAAPSVEDALSAVVAGPAAAAAEAGAETGILCKRGGLRPASFFCFIQNSTCQEKFFDIYREIEKKARNHRKGMIQ